MKRQPFLAGVAVVVFCAAQCRWLVMAWLHSPFDRLAWCAFLLWLLPVVLFAARRHAWRPDESLLIAAAACSLLGAATEFNFLRHAGFACALVAFAPWNLRFRLFWLATAFFWMPAFGWAASNLGVVEVILTRFGLVIAAALTALVSARVLPRGRFAS